MVNNKKRITNKIKFTLLGTCTKCGEQYAPLYKYKGDKLCDNCLRFTKLVPLAANKRKQEDSEKEFFDAMISLP